MSIGSGSSWLNFFFSSANALSLILWYNIDFLTSVRDWDCIENFFQQYRMCVVGVFWISRISNWILLSTTLWRIDRARINVERIPVKMKTPRRKRKLLSPNFFQNSQQAIPRKSDFFLTKKILKNFTLVIFHTEFPCGFINLHKWWVKKLPRPLKKFLCNPTVPAVAVVVEWARIRTWEFFHAVCRWRFVEDESVKK